MFGPSADARAQRPPYSDPRDNVGSWSWDKPQPRSTEESDESDENEEDGGDKQEEIGTTAWERMQAEQQPSEKEPPRQEVLKSLSPSSLWRWWRGEKDTGSAEATAGKSGSTAATEETLDDTEEPSEAQ